jgi:hypothetical protein
MCGDSFECDPKRSGRLSVLRKRAINSFQNKVKKQPENLFQIECRLEVLLVDSDAAREIREEESEPSNEDEDREAAHKGVSFNEATEAGFQDAITGQNRDGSQRCLKGTM